MIGVGRLFAGLNRIVGGGGDHGAVVGAEFWLWEVDMVGVLEGFLEFVAEQLVGGNAAGEQDGFDWIILAGGFELLNKNFNGRELKTCSKIANLLFGEVGLELVTRGGNRETEFFLDGA